jgi:hypothetical protein
MSTITRKPKKESTIAAKPRKPSEAQIAKVIGKGGLPANNGTAETAVVNLRVPGDALARIDQAVSSRSPKTSRHYWLLEAVLEKLERDSA